MASSDKVKLYGIREDTSTYATTPTALSVGVTAIAESGDNFTFTLGSSDPGFVAGQRVHLAGLTGDAEVLEGVYEVVSESGTTLTVKLPAGMVDLITRLGLSVGSGLGATVCNHVPFRLSSEDLRFTPNKSESDEITGNRGVQDLQEDGRGAGGPVNSPFIVQWIFNYVQMLAGNTWTYQGSSGLLFGVTAGTDELAIAASGDNFTLTKTVSGGGPSNFSGVVEGDMVKFTGGLYEGISGLVTETPTANILTISHATIPASLLASGITEDETTLYVADVLQDGATIYSETVERRYTDLAVLTAGAPRFTGCVVDSLSVTGGAQQAPTAAFQFQAADEESPTPVAFLDAITPNAKVNGKRVNGADVEVWVSASTGGCVQDFTLNWSNNLDPRLCTGSAEVQGMDMRALSIDGSFTRRYASATEYNKFLTSTDSSCMIKFKADSGAQLVCYLERTNYSDAGRPAGGRNQSLVSTLNFQALELEGESYTAKWFYWAD